MGKSQKESSNEILQIKDLKVHFPLKTSLKGKDIESVKAVDTVNLNIQKGETLGIVGESCCIKSTLANTSIQLIQPTTEKIINSGDDLTKLKNKESQKVSINLQMIIQDPFSSLNPR